MHLLNSCTLTLWLLLRALSNKVYILSQRRLHILSNDTLCSLYEVVYRMIQFHSFFLHFGLTIWQYFLDVLMITFKNGVRHELGWSNSGGGGRFLGGNLWHSPPASMTSRVASVTSKWRAKCSSRRRINISILSRKYCSDFLDLEVLWFLLS